MPEAIRTAVWKLQQTIEYAAPSLSLIPKRLRANMTAMFQGPNPPLDGTPMLQDPKTKTTRPGIRPQ